MSCCFCISVEESTVSVVETCGKFSHLATPGLGCILPWSEAVATFTTRVQELKVSVESKTKDNVFLDINLTLQCQFIPEKIDSVCYRISNYQAMIRAHVMNSIRAKIPMYKLEALYVERGTISQQLKDEVDGVMESYGIDILNALIEDITPAYGVSAAMDEIQQVQRLRVAAVDAAETKKLARVRAAEASCTARRLAGEGLAQQRKAIVAGLVSSVKEVKSDVPSLTSDDAATMLMMNQYYDTLRAIAAKSSGSVLVWETSGGLEKVAQQMQQGLGHLLA
eukprot:gene12370-8496_t